MASKLLVLFALGLLLSCVPHAQAFFTPIHSCTQLQEIRGDLAGTHQLVAHINCADTRHWNGGAGFEPIGSLSSPYTGTFDAQGYTIDGLSIYRPTETRVGLFGYATGQFRNVRLTNANITGLGQVAGLLGHCISPGIVENAHITAWVSAGAHAGAVVGMSSCPIRYCSSSGSVSVFDRNGGGIVGQNIGGEVTESFSSATILGTDRRIGGLVGTNNKLVRNSFATGTVAGTNSAGGLVGYHNGDNAVIVDSYSTGPVSGFSTGGLVGTSGSTTIVNASYWNTETSGQPTSPQGIGKTTAEMFQGITYTQWNFTHTWWIHEGNAYPALRWAAPFLKNPIADHSIASNAAYTLPLSTAFEDVSHAGLSYSLALSPNSTLPAWLALHPQNQTLSGTPHNSDVGNYTLIVTACSVGLQCVSDEFILYVRVSVGISNCTALQAMQSDLRGVYHLTDDIDCSDTTSWNGGMGFVPIGSNLTPFSGSLEGRGKIIADLSINRPTENNIALIGYMSSSANLVDVGMISANIAGNSGVGALVGGNDGGQISLCYASATLSGQNDVGGLVGANNGTLTLSHVNATVSGQHTVGGLAGSHSGTITYAYAIGSVTATSGSVSRAGGLVGSMHSGIVSHSYAMSDTSGTEAVGGFVGEVVAGTIFQCYATGPVSGTDRIGGFAGMSAGAISECYSTGIVSGTTAVGGFVGHLEAGTASGYWNTQTSGQAASAAGTGKTTSAMHQQATFVSWDFTDTWWIEEGAHSPILQMVSPPLVQNPIVDQNTLANVFFAFTVPGNTFFDFTSQAITFSATQTHGAALPGWLLFFPSNQTFSGWPGLEDRRQYSLTMTACDDMMLCSSSHFVLNVNNQAPTLVQPIPDQRFPTNVSFVFTPAGTTFSDSEGDTITYTAALAGGSTLPTWLSFNSTTGTLSGTIPISQTASLQVNITAHDGHGGQASDNFMLSPNLLPTLQGTLDDQEAIVGNPFLHTFPDTLFDEPDGEPLIYTATQTNNNPLPAWLTLGGSNGRTFLGTPSNGDKGFLFVLLVASDPHGEAASVSFTITVSDLTTNNPPFLAANILDQMASVNELWTFIVPTNTFDDIDGDPLAYVATLEGASPLPTWLTFDDQSQTFSGIPTAPEVIRISVRVSDGRGGFALDTFTLTIQNTANQPPILLNDLPSQSVNVNSRYDYPIPANTFSDPDGDTLLYTATQAGNKPLPGWLKFDAPSRTFSGSPTNTDTDTFADRTHSIQVCAADEEGSACSTFVLAVVGVSLLEMVGTSLIVGVSALSAIYGCYVKRIWLWNTLMKYRYRKTYQTVVIGGKQYHNKDIEVSSQDVDKLVTIRNGRQTENPGWIKYGSDPNHFLMGTPMHNSAGVYEFCLVDFRGYKLESHRLHVKKNEEEPDAGRGIFEKLVRYFCCCCRQNTKEADIEMAAVPMRKKSMRKNSAGGGSDDTDMTPEHPGTDDAT